MDLSDDLTYNKYEITMTDGTVWQIPVSVIALNHARIHASLTKTPLNIQLFNKTIPFFNDDENNIHEHAKTMNWSSVVKESKCISRPDDPDYQVDWEAGNNYEIF